MVEFIPTLELLTDAFRTVPPAPTLSVAACEVAAVLTPVTLDPAASIYSTSYLSVPVPTVPFSSLLTSSYQALACAKYPLPLL